MSTLKSESESQKESLIEEILDRAENIHREKGIEFHEAVNKAKQEILHPQTYIPKHPSAGEILMKREKEQTKRTMAVLQRLNIEPRKIAKMIKAIHLI